MHRQRNNPSSTMNQGNMITQKENDKSPETKVMEDCDLSYRELKIAAMN